MLIMQYMPNDYAVMIYDTRTRLPVPSVYVVILFTPPWTEVF